MTAIDPFSEDPIVDIEYPASQITFPIDSKGSTLNAIMEIASGKGPHKTIILLHGFPGNEKNFDLAHILRRAGYNVLVFYYRGSWGSGGDYSLSNCIQDVHTTIQHVRNEEFAKTARVDRGNIILVGHSWGGFCALYAGINDESIKKIGSISGFNIGSFGKDLDTNPKIKSTVIFGLFYNINPLKGTSGEKLIDEIRRNKENWDLIKYGEELSLKDLFITAAYNDEVLPREIHHDPLIESIMKSSDSNVISNQYHTTHSYSDHRIALARDLLKWLND